MGARSEHSGCSAGVAPKHGLRLAFIGQGCPPRYFLAPSHGMRGTSSFFAPLISISSAISTTATCTLIIESSISRTLLEYRHHGRRERRTQHQAARTNRPKRRSHTRPLSTPRKERYYNRYHPLPINSLNIPPS